MLFCYVCIMFYSTGPLQPLSLTIPFPAKHFPFVFSIGHQIGIVCISGNVLAIQPVFQFAQNKIAQSAVFIGRLCEELIFNRLFDFDQSLVTKRFRIQILLGPFLYVFGPEFFSAALPLDDILY